MLCASWMGQAWNFTITFNNILVSLYSTQEERQQRKTLAEVIPSLTQLVHVILLTGSVIQFSEILWNQLIFIF